MSIAASARLVNEMCYIHICVDEYNEGEISGRIFNASLNEPLYYYSALELIKCMDSIFDNLDYPHAGMNLRSFINIPRQENVTKGAPAAVKAQPRTPVKRFTVRGKAATFRVRVVFRQNASWQGFINWIERDITEEFKSCLEFMELLDSAFQEDE